MKPFCSLLLIFFLSLFIAVPVQSQERERERVRDLGITPGILPTGTLNAITDVEGVLVGHRTVIEGEGIRTGVTAVLPHGGNLYRERVPGSVYVGNGFGKALGFTQVRELGELETPVVLTNTLSIFHAAHGLADYMLKLPGNENVRSVNPVVGETNDGWLNDIRARVITAQHVSEALESAAGGAVAEGNVGAGTGTRALGFKGGIGTSSRVIPEEDGGYTVGVLVQSNFGGILTVDGVPVGEELGNHYLASHWITSRDPMTPHQDLASIDTLSDPMTSPNGYNYDIDGSVMIVVATDAPITSRNLERLAKRAFLGIARVGGFASNGSGDYVIAFSTHPDVRISLDERGPVLINSELKNSEMSPLFLAAVEATEESILNSLFMAQTMQGAEGRIQQALPLDEVMEIMKKYGRE